MLRDFFFMFSHKNYSVIIVNSKKKQAYYIDRIFVIY